MFHKISKVDLIITGNFDEAISGDLVETFKKHLGAKINKKLQVRKNVVRKLLKLQEKNVFLINPTKTAQNSILHTSTLGYYTYTRECALNVLRNMINPYLFDTLRSSQGIGYVVMSNYSVKNNVLV